MKTKVTQKEWNDARDKFLCAIIKGLTKNGDDMNWVLEQKWIIERANEITSELYEVEDHNVDTNEKVDTRPFNPKVVEIFNQYLPKEIAPLAIEAHKRSCEDHKAWADGIVDYFLGSLLAEFIDWTITVYLGNFEELAIHTTENTITATEEQLREWFPSAYQNEGGENE
jgi:hypothetical protein